MVFYHRDHEEHRESFFYLIPTLLRGNAYGIRILIIIASTFILFTASPVISYVPDDLDFVTMDDGAVSRGQPAAPSGRTYTVPSINYKMVYISPGTFMMGSPLGEPKRESDERQHKVTLTKAFYVGVTEATVGQWRSFTQDTGYRTEAETGGGAYIYTGKKWEKKKGYYWDNPGFSQTEKHPVTCVSWNDAQKFIKFLNQQEGGNKYRLPTEAEWEYACRAGTTTPFSTGSCISTDQANYNGNYPMPGCSKGKYRKKTIELIFRTWKIEFL